MTYEGMFVRHPGIHKGTVLWLHGLGEDLALLPRLLQMAVPDSIRIVAPQAPIRAVTCLQGKDQRSWTDCFRRDAELDMEDNHKLSKEARIACDLIHSYLDHETRSIDSSKIVLAGSGQGAAMAICAG